MHNLLDDLRAFAIPERLGEPFGEGVGLEDAMEHMFRRLEGLEDARACGLIMMVDLLSELSDPGAADEMERIMGATEAQLGACQLGDETRSAVRGLGSAARTLLAEFQGPGGMWDLWEARDDVAGEMLCWHSVARLRLAAAGRMSPVVRPS